MAAHTLYGPNYNAAFYAVFGVFVGLSTISLALRLFSRQIKRGPYFVEDYFAIIAWASAPETICAKTSC